jgi:ADP-ribose pyrophosphatase
MIDENKLIEREKSSELIFDGRVLHLYRDEVILPDGSEGVREYCNHNGGVCVLPLTDDGEVILVKQYRYAHRKCTLEIPAGKLDYAEEDHLEAAMRELREETGLTSANVTYLGEYIPSPALLSEVIYLYYATDLSIGAQDLDEDEFLSVEKNCSFFFIWPFTIL